MKTTLCPKLGALLVASVLFAGTAHAALTANGMKIHNGLEPTRVRSAFATMWTSNGIDPSQPLSKSTAASRR